MGFNDRARVPELRLSFYWDDSRKEWVVISRRIGAEPMTTRIESTAPLDVVGERLVLESIARDMEGWLY